MNANAGTALRVVVGIALLGAATTKRGGPFGSPTTAMLSLAGLALIASGAVSCVPLYNALGVD